MHAEYQASVENKYSIKIVDEYNNNEVLQAYSICYLDDQRSLLHYGKDCLLVN